ncbi:hypothetical protein ACH4UT_01875 [Streptomyces sp. NPDC020799]|uniref:hypothetical protein n=1 Tax=Streptomyces sp. NPDC020799 TaxID=3365091 RepID=UPI0037A896CE
MANLKGQVNMANFISYLLERVRVWFAPRTPGCGACACRAVHVANAPEPALADPPIGSDASPHHTWITAHGIDFRPRQPHHADVSR